MTCTNFLDRKINMTLFFYPRNLYFALHAFASVIPQLRETTFILLICLCTLHTVPLKSKLPVSSRFSRDESLDSRDKSLVSRDSLKQQFWNKLQANCLARSRLQSCAKVMRTNFALFSSKYCRTFDRYFAAFVRQLKRNFGDNSPRQAINRIENSPLRIFKVGKYRRKFTSNQKCPPTFRRPINMNSHGKT